MAYFKKRISNDDYSGALQSDMSMFAVLYDKEDVCTQTDNSASLCTKQGITQGLKETEMDSSTFGIADFTVPPEYQRKSSFLKRTHSTMKLLREKHRENERLRHHSLNQHLRLICKQVPGSAEDGKETKVVMMQRIISYIAYLENTLKYLSLQLNMSPDPSWLLLTSSVHEIEKSGLWEFSILSSDDSDDGEKYAGSGGLDLSFSASYSTLEPKFSDYRNRVDEASQDSIVPSSSLFTHYEDSNTCFYDDWTASGEENILQRPENYESLLSRQEQEETIFEVSLNNFEIKLMDTPEVKWLGSPERSNALLQGTCDNQFGIRSDPTCQEDLSFDISHSVVVSPNQVLPQITVKQQSRSSNSTQLQLNGPRTFHQDVASRSLFRNSKRKQLSPKRAPLYEIGNWLELPSDCQSHLDELNQIIGNTNESTSQQVHVVPKTEIEEDTAKVPVLELQTESAKVVRDANVDSLTAKLDLRKSSWMNGFMMYSRIHRKNFIKQNPGLQAASISKLMGQRWRGMTADQQMPYREQARICSQELQRVLDKSYQC